MDVVKLEEKIAQATNQQEKITAINALAWELVKPDPTRATQLCEEATMLAQAMIPVDTLGIAAAQCTLGNIQYYEANYDLAIQHSLEVVKLLVDTPPSQTLARAYSTIASSYRVLGDLSEGLAYFLKQQEVSQEAQDPEGHASALVGLGSIYYDMDKDEQALSCFEKSLTIFAKMRDTYWQALVLNNISFMHYKMGAYNRALLPAQQSLTIAQHSQHYRMVVAASLTLGEVHEHLGDLDNALAYLQNGSHNGSNL